MGEVTVKLMTMGSCGRRLKYGIIYGKGRGCDMDLITSKRSWLLAPVITLLCSVVLLIVWAVMDPQTLEITFDNKGQSPVELMTLPLFALIVPLAWLCPPNGGGWKRQCGWSALWSVLGVMAIIRETDIHKMLFAEIWPDVVATFQGTVFKMRFLKAGNVPLMPKLFVLAFFIVFFVAVLLPLVRYIVPLIKGFFRLEPVAWTMAFFGGVSVMVLTVDRLPANLRHAGIAASDSLLALLKAFEEGGEAMMALLALLAILQSHLIFARGRDVR